MLTTNSQTAHVALLVRLFALNLCCVCVTSQPCFILRCGDSSCVRRHHALVQHILGTFAVRIVQKQKEKKKRCKHRHITELSVLDTFRASPHFVFMHSPLLPRGRLAAHMPGCGGTGPAAEHFELVFVLGTNKKIQELRWSLNTRDTSYWQLRHFKVL